MKNNYFLYYEKYPGWIDPESVFISLFDKKQSAFWLDSSRVEENLSRFSYMGLPKKVLDYKLNSSSLNIFSYLSKQLYLIGTKKTKLPFDFIGGFVGYFGYELKALNGIINKYVSNYPDSLWFFVDKFLAFDHKEKEIYLVCLSNKTKTDKKWFQQIRDQLKKTKFKPKQKVSKKKIPPIFQLQRSKKQYLEDIKKCMAYFRAGESYQICLTNSITTQADIDPLDLYLTLRKINLAPYAGYLKYKDLAILSSSPERFIKIDQNRVVESKPIKGTIKRSNDPKTDKKLALQLQLSEKDRAENMMIVDLVRNDLGKVCEIGSIRVSKLLKIESYQTVHQLVSTIKGKLRDDISVIDCIQSSFPGGSMTGAPKIRTMQILEKLEGKPRGVYSGALGFLSANGAIDLSIIIRTIVMKNKKISIGAGGAILIQSDPQKEYDEMRLKAQALIQSIIKTNGNLS